MSEMKYTYKNRTEYDIKKACNEYGFLYTKRFKKVDNDYILSKWNGIGAKGSWINNFIPNHILGVDISLASAPHDCEWSFEPKSKIKFHLSNLYLFFNIAQILRKHIKWKWLMFFAYSRTAKYYFAVETSVGYENYMKHEKERNKQ
jgi:hypothetical protein